MQREGLKSGEWVQIKQLSENSYGFVPVVDVDLKKLAVFAIRIGVEAKRAANILSRGDEIVLQAIMARGESYAQILFWQPVHPTEGRGSIPCPFLACWPLSWYIR